MNKMELVGEVSLGIMQNMLGNEKVPDKIIDRFLAVKRLCDKVSVQVHPSVIAFLVSDVCTMKMVVEKAPPLMKVSTKGATPFDEVDSGDKVSDPISAKSPAFAPKTQVEFERDGKMCLGVIKECVDSDTAIVLYKKTEITMSLDDLDLAE